MTSPAENIVVNIPRLEGMTFLFSNVFGTVAHKCTPNSKLHSQF